MNRLQDLACQRVGTGSRNLGDHCAAHEGFGAFQVDDAELWRAARDAAGLVDRVYEDLVEAADEGPVLAALPLLLGFVQDLQPATLLLGRDVVSPTDGRGTRPR